MHETAYAKINLALHVRERMADGYHRIETVFAFAEDGDELRVEEGEGLTLTLTGPLAGGLSAGDDNLILKAARALQQRYGVREGAALILDKRLPIASGIGGGSADAAAALRLLTRWWQIEADEADLLEIAAGIGADVPACLVSRPARGDGRGDILRPVSDPPSGGTPLLLVNPGVALATGAVFAAWDGVDRGAMTNWREAGNHLEAPALKLVPPIAEVLGALCGARFARMSGSGATCIGLYDSAAERDAAAATIGAAHADWWVLATRLRA